MVEFCFIKHGYPLGFRQRSASPSMNFKNSSKQNSTTDTALANTNSSNGSLQDQYKQLITLLQQHLTTNSN